jgi:ssDNA-binding Zn-finger/Zn-ribbon topoisomerase 1
MNTARSDFSKAPPLLQSCPQCGAEMRVARREPAPGNPAMERLNLECPKCGHTAGKMQGRPKAG